MILNSKKLIQNYGYVPFKGFQFVILLLIFLMITFPHPINNFLNSVLNINDSDILREENLKDNIGNINVIGDVVANIYLEIKVLAKLFIILIPLFFMAYYDVIYSSFSMHNLGVTKFISEDVLNSFFRVFGSYGIIQVLAQDVGIKTGKNQRNLIQKPMFQLLLYVCTAYAITDNRSEAIQGAVLYFILKGVYSKGITSNVCFEDV
tara:strand:- start:1433 stop:2050 length:618 start_codon:yes stop_codon:yes gene_type:complete